MTTSTAPVLQAENLGKRYRNRNRWALSDCTLSIPAGRIVGLVGPNGAGKTTLLNLAAGLLRPDTGHIRVLGAAPAADAAHLARVGYVAQDAPLYAQLSVADHLQLGAHLNPGWDAAWATARITAAGLPPKAKTRTLSGGQRAQLAVTLAVAKRPELLILDEPAAALDPLARREFLDALADAVTGSGAGTGTGTGVGPGAGVGMSVVLSSHLLTDLERVCDHLIILTAGRVQANGAITDLLAAHRARTKPDADVEDMVLTYLSRGHHTQEETR
ncbi:MAG: ABC transporter ATP-binding protein [Catenulispora sp.]|nr:ABC transporter ATP-binding protein [Catenulispora sp.]